MTVENLHDAIGQLPADLIAKADEKRCRKPKVLPMKRYAAMAACFVLLLGCGLFLNRLAGPKGSLMKDAMLGAEQAACEAAPEEPMDAAPMETLAAEPAETESASNHSLVTDEEGNRTTSGSGTACFASIWKKELTQYCRTEQLGTPTEYGQIVLIRSRTELDTYIRTNSTCFDLAEFETLCQVYTKEWFEENDLLLFTYPCLPEILGPEPLEFDTQLPADTIRWGIRISGGDSLVLDTAQNWHIMMDVNKNAIDPEDELLFLMDAE